MHCTQEMAANPTPENNANDDVIRLVQWINKHIPTDRALLGDMTVSSSIRSGTRNPIVVNPQYESVEARRRVQFYYALSACPPIEEVWHTVTHNYSDPYVVLNIFRCSTPRDSSAITVLNVTAHLDEKRYRCPDNVPFFKRCCIRLQVETSHFEMVYRNGRYAVLAAKPQQDITGPALTLDQFNYTKALGDPQSWLPWFNNCLRTDPHCGLNIAQYARVWLDHYSHTGDPVGASVPAFLYHQALEKFPTDADVVHHYGEYLDFDLGKPQEAYQYMKKSYDYARGNRPRYIVDYILYLDQTRGRVQELPMIIILLEDFDRRYESVDDPDVEQMVKAASMAMAIARDKHLTKLTDAKREALRRLAWRMWEKAKYLNVHDDEVERQWVAFEGRPKTKLQILYQFMFNR
mmetsp:Transcript_30754/g.76345  ORF Transcript_30754/g.76345 Transcript_30754/m.76345 type:complete len:405 (-) Transcript_30754:1299-2513(-)